MKYRSFFHAGFLTALVVALASCGVPLGASGDYYEDEPVRGNVYYGAPYYGAPNTIIVERDPFTGRYYQVSPGIYGNGAYGRPAYPYRGRPYYGNRNNNRNNGSYRPSPQVQQPRQAPAQQPSQDEREKARESILGKKKS